MSPVRTSIDCPQCGLTSEVDLNRRDAAEFCARCDYPLFWAREPDPMTDDAAALRAGRLPGTEGRTVVTSAPCPWCDEPNALSAVHCTRCGQLMHPAVEPDPEPETVVALPAVVPPSGFPWLVVLMALALGILVLVGLLTLAAR